MALPALAPLRRLNWGCGNDIRPGWVHSDLKDDQGIEVVGDLRAGLPLPDGEFDYVVSMHALQMLSYPEILPGLVELRRVLKPGGVLRLGLPDLDKALDAYRRGDPTHFVVPDEDETTLSGKMIVHLLWYGWSVTLFTSEWIEDLLRRAGFAEVRHCRFGQSASGLAGICELDNRSGETFFVEAER